MTDRAYRTIFGAILLTALYFNMAVLVYALVVMALLEGITNLRVPLLANKLLTPAGAPVETDDHGAGSSWKQLEAERIWRLAVGVMVGILYPFYFGDLWFLLWFMGFAILGAGISGVCPVLLAIRGLGFK